jgi:anti-sigma regulatory factor (Ser/Thr protein kinase)
MPATGAMRITLPADEKAPGAARRFLREARCPLRDAEVLEDAALLVSELVTNAIRHAAPPITLEVVCQPPDGLQVRVTDGSPLPPANPALTAHAESGRGMALVDVVSDSWGVEPAEPGKAVWFRLTTACTASPRDGGAGSPAGTADPADPADPAGAESQDPHGRHRVPRPATG